MEQILNLKPIMKNKLNRLPQISRVISMALTICFCLLFSQNSKANGRGGDGSGGGTFVVVSGKKTLLDLYVNNSQLGSQTLPLTLTPALSKIRIDLLRNQTGPLMSEVIQRIESWRSVNPILVDTMLETLMKAPIYLVNARLKVQDKNYDLENKAVPDSIETAALTIGKFGTLVSYPDMQETESESQIGTIVHEIFRLLFIVQGKNDVSPKDIQRLTALFLQPKRDVAEINKLELLGESMTRVVGIVTKVQQSSEFLLVNEVCTYVDQLEFLKTYRSKAIVDLRSSCSMIQNKDSQMTVEAFMKQTGDVADSVEIFVDSGSDSAASQYLSNTSDRRAEIYSTESDVRIGFRKKSREIARNLRSKVIDYHIAKLEKDAPAVHQLKVQFNNHALNLNQIVFILNAGIEEANKQNGDSRIVTAAKETLMLLQSIGLLK